jgi:NAD(P)H dehydrogenase (quinone)
MHVYIVYAHPSPRSFSREVLEAFCQGLDEAGHTYELGDLYAMGFKSEMDAGQYQREVGMDPLAPLPADVMAEHAKIDRAQGLAFIFPVWWSDCPAKLKGWFDRVLTYGYAYFYDENEERFTRINIDKALVLCSAGHTLEHLQETGITQAMSTILLNDRLLGVGVASASLEILGGMMPNDPTYRQANLDRAYELGRSF